MKISNTPTNYERQAYINEISENKMTGAGENHATGKNEKSRNDIIVNLSHASRDVHIAKEAVAATPEIRTYKVEAMKQAINSGTYKVNTEQIAEKVLGTNLNKIV